jgi:lipoate-protein ligase A
MDWRLISDRPASGAWNMAVDEALLESVGRAGQGGCLRFYAWSEPTLSLGYFQRCAERESHVASRGCPLVRRSTGGGAILHDVELTYSLTLAVSSHVQAGLRTWYEALHTSLIGALATFGVDAALYTEAPASRVREEPFLCFQRRSVGDVVLGGMKIAGSAQRRHHGAFLQHGSVLLGASPAAPEFPGIRELASSYIAPDDLARRWHTCLSDRLGLVFREDALTPTEQAAAQRCANERFLASPWTHRR